MSDDAFREHIRMFPDFPKKGIVFWDVMPIFNNPVLFSKLVKKMSENVKTHKPTKIVAPEARGFILGSAIANQLSIGFVPIRKAGKLPGDTFDQKYALEYGSATIEVQKDAIKSGDRIVFIDDVFATGGTAEAAINLLSHFEGTLVGLHFLLYLTYLSDQAITPELPIHSLMKISSADLPRL